MEGAKAKTETTQCEVCGDVACGRNSNAITCSTCRDFFRRYYLRTEDLQCRFGSNCKIDVLTRRRCKKCRLDKCIAIGMKKECSMSEEQKEVDRERMQKNHEKRTNPEVASESQGFTDSKAVSPDETQDLEQPQQPKGLVTTTNLCLPSTSSESLIRTSLVKNKELSYLERDLLEELIVANEELKMPLEFGVNDPSLLDVINMTDSAIQRLVLMSIKLKGFKNLSQNDQVALLKYGCTELMILRSVMSYNPENESWEHSAKQGPKMSIKVDILKEAKGNVYENYKRFITSFHSQWRTDENVMLILCGIVLFAPERRYLHNKAVIKITQDSYCSLLKSYLESVYKQCEAEAIYIKLKRKLLWLHSLNDNHIRVYRNVNPNDVLPFLVEIYDLKL